MVRIRHIRRQCTAAVPYAITILDPEPTHGLQQVRELLFREILHFITEHPHIGTTGTDGRTVQRDEGEVETGVEHHGIAPVGTYVVHAVAPLFRRFLVHNIMDALLPPQLRQSVHQRGNHILMQIGIRIGHPCERCTRAVLRHLLHPFSQHLHRLGRCTSCNPIERPRHHHGNELRHPVGIAYLHIIRYL